MKECPQCHEQFDDGQVFCDQDGSNLLDQTDSLRQALTKRQQSTSALITGVIGGFIGVIICVLLYALFLAPNPKDLEPQAGRTTAQETTAPGRAELAPAPQTNPIVLPSPSPEEEQPSPSPSPTESPAQAVTAPAALNNGPIATGTKEAREAEHAIIKMKDGSTVDADAAWEDAQGIWYRRSGLVSFVEKSRVEAIIEQPQRQPAKAEVKTP